MSLSDLEKYYSSIITIKKEYKEEESNDEEDESPTKLYSATSKETKEKVLLKVINKKILKNEEDYDFHINHIEKENEINTLCSGSEEVIKLKKYRKTNEYFVFEKEYCELDLKEYI